MPKKLTQEEFIAKAQEKHKNEDGSFKYGYDKVKYVNSSTNVTITCLVKGHKDFDQTPDKHINRGYGCPICGIISRSNKRRKPLEKFIEEGKETHKNDDGSPKYRYDKVKYVNDSTKVTITCFKHGDFKQIAGDHIRGHGCGKCSVEINSKTNRKPTEIFIEESKEIHKNEDGSPKYGYDKVKYVNSSTNVTITCFIHEEFKQTPSNHLIGHGCKYCGITKRSKTHIKPFDNFLKIVRDIHKKENGDPLYDYSEAKYIDRLTKIDIICFKHGKFQQIPKSHIKGHGCYRCCSNSYSKACISFLNKIPYNIIHFENEGEKKLTVKNKNYKADGYYKASNQEEIDDIFKICEDYYTYRNYDSLEVVIEYHGCFWHGCKECFPDRQELNDVNNCTYEELYNKTEKRKEELIEAGYNYIEIWEHEV
jgi:hypothetical protein